MSLSAGEVISLTQAQSLTDEFKKNFGTETKAYLVDSLLIKSILDQEGCEGIRIYNGYDIDSGERNLVLVGVDESEKDLANGVILDKLAKCPSHCDSASPLYF